MKNKHLLFLTDGAPTQGDAELQGEQAMAKRLGVRIHTVFIGQGDYPPILDTLALATNGARFQAIPEYETGVIRLWDREDGVPAPTHAETEATRAATHVGDSRDGPADKKSGGHGRTAHNASATDISRDTLASDGNSSGALHKGNFAAKGDLSAENMEKALKLMALGRSPISGNPVNGHFRFG